MKKTTLFFIAIFMAFVLFPNQSFSQYDEDDYYEEEYNDPEEKSYDRFLPSILIDYNFPTGDFAEFWGSGFGVVLSFEYKILKELGIGLQSGYYEWDPDPDINLGDHEYKYSNIPVLA